ncbi:AraC family transcriptional regulator [Tichowtungia aerotolerans]|uniref:AraC family transcriptional regulator n=1 Tax=Tichowtungia aerotolerans TaxID=2697043 RepID=A0A6P1M5T1_9BACT|nr:AraC family transcriptional regulator [Tichowtungia aerotolerans]QHI69392.1 AraC family transcriptional regulator [Tichowtungia aerotolerans]
MKEIISYGHFRCTDLAPHKNRGMEITYVEKGMLEWMVEGTQEKVESGSIFFTLPWQVHGSLNPKEPDNQVWHILFHLKEDYPRPRKQFRFPENLGFSTKEMKTLSSVFSSSAQHCFSATPAMRQLMPELIGELQSSHDLRAAHSISLLRMVLVELKRIVTGEAVNTDNHNWSEKKVQSLLAQLSSNCDQQWTLREMAEHCGIQRTRLNTVFQKLTGSTPMEYLGRLRMERAKTLLRETDIKIIDIAFECGFSSSQYFANTFKNVTGMTPSQYRTHATGLTEAELKKWSNVDFRSDQEELQRIQRLTEN